LYGEAQTLVEASDQSLDLELVFNLWLLLFSENGGAQVARFEERTQTLKGQLDRLAKDSSRPNNALEARTMRLFVDLGENLKQKNRNNVDATLREFKNVLHAAKTLGRYPVERLVTIIEEVGSALNDSSVYDELFEIVVSLVAERRSEGGSGKVLLRGGYQKLEAEKPYEAIRLLGRSQEKLSKHEYLDELLQALIGCGLAYERTSLLWAARANLLMAAADAISEFGNHGHLGLQALRCLRRLTWLELQLGRPIGVLSFTIVSDALERNLRIGKDSADALKEERETIDIVLGMLFLNAPFSRLNEASFLPDILERMGYFHSRVALLYALGYETQLREEKWIPETESDDSLKKLFATWANQSAKNDLADDMELGARSFVTLRSIVLGIAITAITPNELRSIQLAETILAVLESMLATSLDRGVYPYRERLELRIASDKEMAETVSFAVSYEDGEPIIEIRYAPDHSPKTRRERGKFRDLVIELMGKILELTVMIPDPTSYFASIMDKERAYSRALDFADVSITIRNVLGDNPMLSIREWLKEVEAREFPLKRTADWNDQRRTASREKRVVSETGPHTGSGEPPPEMFETERAKHRDRRVLSLIDVPLWDRGRWMATMFVWPRDDLSAAPLLALCFKDPEAARSIFQAWRKKLGDVDERDELRISILTGIDRSNPHAYNVVVGTNFDVTKAEERFVIYNTVSRINRMEASSSRNLDGFLGQLRTARRYILAPGHYVDESTPPRFFAELGIGKVQLHVRPAWQIGENDPDSCGVRVKDNPIIPKEVSDPPVLRTLHRLRELQKRHARSGR
jgi:hypothetical protein